MQGRHLLIATSALTCCLTLSAHAQQQRRGAGGAPTWERMANHDTNGDGTITAEEFRGPEQAWARFDTNKDGNLTEEEFNAALKTMPERPTRGSAKPDNAPQVGTDAPAVSALAIGTEDLVDLSDPKRITVLAFGSHT